MASPGWTDSGDAIQGELEITLEDEKNTFSVPSCVIIPVGMQHGPIVTKSVENPFGMYMVRLDKGDAFDINPA